MKFKPVIALAFILLASPAIASDELSADEIKALFSNKTFDILNVKKNKRLKGYDSKNGKHLVYIPWKDKISKRKWWVKGNMHCTSHPKRGDNCKTMKHVGGGVYHGFSKGEHTHTLSNFRDGKHL